MWEGSAEHFWEGGSEKVARRDKPGRGGGSRFVRFFFGGGGRINDLRSVMSYSFHRRRINDNF